MVRRTEEVLRCSFCGKSQNEVRKLIAGPTVYICNECIDICNEIISDDEQQETVGSRPPLPKPPEIKAFLDEYVIGQEETKKRLAVAVYQHYKRIEMSRRGNANGVEIQKGPESHENGKFAWIMDLDGNKLELWEPMLFDEKNKS